MLAKVLNGYFLKELTKKWIVDNDIDGEIYKTYGIHRSKGQVRC